MSANSLTQPNIENFLVTLEANAGTWESSRASLVEEQLLAALALHNEMLVEALETNPGMSESSRTSLAAQPHVSTLSPRRCRCRLNHRLDARIPCTSCSSFCRKPSSSLHRRTRCDLHKDIFRLLLG